MSKGKDSYPEGKPKKTSPLSSLSKRIPSLPKSLDISKITRSLPKSLPKLPFLKTFNLGDSGKMGDSGKVGGRPMKYPYTLGAKLAQFPYKFFIKNCWPYKYYLIGIAVSLPVMLKISKGSNSPTNVATWHEIRKELFNPHGHH